MRVATNPYHIEGPLGVGEAFVGRSEILAWIRERLQAGERTLVLYGLPKIGKTSLLRRLFSYLGPGYLCIFNQIPSSNTWKLGDWLPLLYQDISRALQEVGRSWTAPTAEGGAAKPPDPLQSPGMESVWTSLLAVLGNTTLVLMVDGLSLYGRSGDVWSSVLAFVHSLERQPTQIRVLLAVEGHSDQVQADSDSPLAGIPSRELGYLTGAEVGELLEQTAGGLLHYDYDAVRRIYLWTGGHPYFAQLFGYALFDFCGRIGRVNVHAVERVLVQVLQVADGTFSYLWNALSPPAKMSMAALGERHGRHNLFTDADVYNFLRWKRVQISYEDVKQALDELTTKGILTRLGVSSYQLDMELVKRWLEQRKPIASVVHEVKRYQRGTLPRTPVWRREPIRWRSLLSWLMSILLLLLIISFWRSREIPAEPGASTTAGQSSTECASFTATAAVEKGPTTPSRLLPTSQRTRRIAYARKESKEALSSIYVMLEDGSDPQELTDGQAQHTSPAWSPDGTRVLFVSSRSGNRDIWVMDADGKHAVNLTRHPADDWTPAWSPDGDAIAFSSYRDENWEIYLMGIDGSRPVRLTSHKAADVAPCWSPDGQRIAFASYRDGNWEIYAMNRDGSQLQRLTDNEATDFAPAWSPRGDLIAFETYRDGDMEVYVMALDGSQLTNLTREPAADDHGPAWAPEGDRLLYYSNRDGGWDIFKMNADGSGKTNLTHSEALEQGPAWQP